MSKLSIDFVLLDESVVRNGFRCLMSGAELEGFKANPVMLFMHARAEKGYLEPMEEGVVLPIGKWYDIRIEGGRLLAKPEFDDDDEFAVKVQKKVEKGYLNGASVFLDPIAVSDEESLKLAGQPGPTVTQWGVHECSIVDIPNCRGSLALRDMKGKKLQLSYETTDPGVIDYLTSLIPQTTDMDKKLLAAKLGLSETASDAEVSQKLAAVLASAGQVTSLTEENTKLKADLGALNTKLSGMEKQLNDEKVANLVDGAIAARKITAGDREKYVKLAAADFDTTKELLDGMKGHQSLETQLSATSTGDQAEVQELMKLSGRDLYMQGKLERLKQLSLPDFKTKYKEFYGIEFTA